MCGPPPPPHTHTQTEVPSEDRRKDKQHKLAKEMNEQARVSPADPSLVPKRSREPFLNLARGLGTKPTHLINKDIYVPV